VCVFFLPPNKQILSGKLKYLAKIPAVRVFIHCNFSKKCFRFNIVYSLDLDRLIIESCLSASHFIVSSQLFPSNCSTVTDVTDPMSRQCGMTPVHQHNTTCTQCLIFKFQFLCLHSSTQCSVAVGILFFSSVHPCIRPCVCVCVCVPKR